MAYSVARRWRARLAAPGSLGSSATMRESKGNVAPIATVGTTTTRAVMEGARGGEQRQRAGRAAGDAHIRRGDGRERERRQGAGEAHDDLGEAIRGEGSTDAPREFSADERAEREGPP
jgi:hypothetical protein